MTETGDDQLVNELVSWLTEHVTKSCVRDNTAMLLTALGANFIENYKSSFQDYVRNLEIEEEYKKLIPFVKSLCPDLEVLSFEGRFDRAAVRPISMPDLAHPVRSEKLFAKAFWAAFIKKIDPGRKRHFNLRRPFRFSDVAETHERGPSEIEIDPSFVLGVEDNEKVNPDHVRNKIDSWLASNNLSSDQFLMDSLPYHNTDRRVKELMVPQSSIGTYSQRRVAQNFFALIPDDMKRRITIPADIVEFLIGLD